MNEKQRNDLRNLVRGIYKIQKLRIQCGNRVTAAFKTKLGIKPGTKEEDSSKGVKNLLTKLRADYFKITDGVVAVTKRDFQHIGLIHTFTEYSLVETYVRLLEQERKSFKRLSEIIDGQPIWEDWLKDIHGIDYAMAGVLISEIDIEKATYPSSIWLLAGLDVVDGKARSNRKEHLVEKTYIDKNGEEQIKMGITYRPFLKAKLIGVLGKLCFITQKKGKYRQIYLNYRNRLENHPDHKKKTKGHIYNMSIRYMIKIFLIDLYNAWRPMNNLVVHPPYSESKLDIEHRKGGHNE